MKKPLPKVYEHPFSKNTPISPDEGGFFEWVSRLIRLYDTQEHCDEFKRRIKFIQEASDLFEKNSETCAEEFEKRLIAEKKYNQLRRLVGNLFFSPGAGSEDYSNALEELRRYDETN